MTKVFILSFLFICFSSCFRLLENDEEVLSIIDIPKKAYKLKLVYQPSNATIQAAIQVRKVTSKSKEEVLAIYERYNFIDTYKLINDTTFFIVMRDTYGI